MMGSHKTHTFLYIIYHMIQPPLRAHLASAPKLSHFTFPICTQRAQVAQRRFVSVRTLRFFRINLASVRIKR